MRPRLLVLALAFAACDGGTDSSDTSDDSGADTEVLTVENCATSIATDAPAFFRDFFRCVTVTREGATTVIATTAEPPHLTAYYGEGDPNYTAFDSQGGTRAMNQGHVEAQDVIVIVPDEPVAKTDLVIDDALVDREGGTSDDEFHAEMTPGSIGVSLDGVPEYHGVAAPGDDLADEAVAFDSYEGHPDFENVYHYHGYSPGPLEVLAYAGLVETPVVGRAEVELYAVMCDGTLVLGCTELDGSAPADALDAQGGHVSEMRGPDGTLYYTSRYHTHVCAALDADAFSPEIQYYTTCNGV